MARQTIPPEKACDRLLALLDVYCDVVERAVKRLNPEKYPDALEAWAWGRRGCEALGLDLDEVAAKGEGTRVGIGELAVALIHQAEDGSVRGVVLKEQSGTDRDGKPIWKENPWPVLELALSGMREIREQHGTLLGLGGWRLPLFMEIQGRASWDTYRKRLRGSPAFSEQLQEALDELAQHRNRWREQVEAVRAGVLDGPGLGQSLFPFDPNERTVELWVQSLRDVRSQADALAGMADRIRGLQAPDQGVREQLAKLLAALRIPVWKITSVGGGLAHLTVEEKRPGYAEHLLSLYEQGDLQSVSIDLGAWARSLRNTTLLTVFQESPLPESARRGAEPVIRWLHDRVEKALLTEAERGSTIMAGSTPATPQGSSDAPLSPAAMAKAYGLRKERLRKRLERARKTDDSCFLQVRDRRAHQPEFLYYPSNPTVKHIIEALQQQGRTSSQTSS